MCLKVHSLVLGVCVLLAACKTAVSTVIIVIYFHLHAWARFLRGKRDHCMSKMQNWNMKNVTSWFFCFCFFEKWQKEGGTLFDFGSAPGELGITAFLFLKVARKVLRKMIWAVNREHSAPNCFTNNDLSWEHAYYSCVLMCVTCPHEWGTSALPQLTTKASLPNRSLPTRPAHFHQSLFHITCDVWRVRAGPLSCSVCHKRILSCSVFSPASACKEPVR